jgi:hypothetical protein
MAKTGAGVTHQRRANDVDLLRNPGVAALVARVGLCISLEGRTTDGREMPFLQGKARRTFSKDDIEGAC